MTSTTTMFSVGYIVSYNMHGNVACVCVCVCICFYFLPGFTALRDTKRAAAARLTAAIIERPTKTDQQATPLTLHLGPRPDPELPPPSWPARRRLSTTTEGTPTQISWSRGSRRCCSSFARFVRVNPLLFVLLAVRKGGLRQGADFVRMEEDGAESKGMRGVLERVGSSRDTRMFLFSSVMLKYIILPTLYTSQFLEALGHRLQ